MAALEVVCFPYPENSRAVFSKRPPDARFYLFDKNKTTWQFDLIPQKVMEVIDCGSEHYDSIALKCITWAQNQREYFSLFWRFLTSCKCVTDSRGYNGWVYDTGWMVKGAFLEYLRWKGEKLKTDATTLQCDFTHSTLTHSRWFVHSFPTLYVTCTV